MVLLALVAGLADAADVRIDATVDPDLRTVRGTLALSEGSAGWVDPLALLPDPPDDLQALRTFPGAPRHGRVSWEAGADGVLTFEARLPRRFGALGATARGLFASGGWYPQRIGPQGLPLDRFDVTVRLPAGALGALGDSVGAGELRWTGTAERAPLAVVPRGRITPITAGRSELWLLTRGRPRRALVRDLADQAALLPLPLSGVVVEGPLRRRLVRPSPGLAFVSDRAFRLTPGFRFAHRRAVGRGLAESLVEVDDPFDRSLAGAALGRIQAARLEATDTGELLGWFRWVPQINALLSSRRLPFYGEVLDLTWPTDPVRDDLAESLAPRAPGTAVLAQVDDRFGPGAGTALGLRLAAGDDRATACAATGVDCAWLAGWQRDVPPQDYRIEVRGGLVTVERDAPPGAPDETVVLAVDGERLPLALDPGPHPLALPSPPRRLVLDPDGHVSQTSRLGDSWPPRYDWTVAGWIDPINLTQAQLFAAGWLTLRRADDTHNLWFGSLSNSRSNLITAEVGWLRKEGPLLDGWTRPHRVRLDASVSLLDPRFAETEGARVALDGSWSWAWDDRVGADFPLRGKRIGVASGGGGVPGTDQVWISGSAHAVGVVSFHPRHAIAGRVTAAIARSPLPHRLLTLGGEGAMRSIPALPACPALDEEGAPAPCTEVATERGIGMVEYRWAPLRNLSVPLGLAWGSELQLAAGLEGLAARVDDHPAFATGVTAGVFALADVLGAQSQGAGLTLGWPLAWDGIPSLAPTAWPEVYLRFEQAF